jgi:hypothetical protein
LGFLVVATVGTLSVKYVHVLLGLVGLIAWLGSLAVLCSFLAVKEGLADVIFFFPPHHTT